eukprot:1745502-Ditylum_brightwellii.AAC.1
MFGKVIGKGVTTSIIVRSILRTTDVCFVANFTFHLIDDTGASIFAFICALTINTSCPVTVTWTVHEIQLFNISVEFGDQITTESLT